MMLHGLIVINKPEGMTSHDVVAVLRRIFRMRRVGHFGTLDPMATGLLLAGLGQVTKFFDFYVGKKKTYTGEIRFGFSTDTYDKTGRPITKPVPVDLEAVDLDALASRFTGEILQLPPPYSAKKKDGTPLYKYARRNVRVEVAPSPVHIYRLDLEVRAPDRLFFTAVTSQGTYIRTLAHDLGQVLETGAHLRELRREQIGEFTLENAVELHNLREDLSPVELLQYLHPIETLLPEFPAVILSHQGEIVARNGGAVDRIHIHRVEKTDPDAEVFRLFSRNGRLLALSRKENRQSGFKPFLVLPDQ